MSIRDSQEKCIIQFLQQKLCCTAFLVSVVHLMSMSIEFSRLTFHVVFTSLRKGSKTVFLDVKKHARITLNIKILLCRVKFYELSSPKTSSFS